MGQPRRSIGVHNSVGAAVGIIPVQMGSVFCCTEPRMQATTCKRVHVWPEGQHMPSPVSRCRVPQCRGLRPRGKGLKKRAVRPESCFL